MKSLFQLLPEFQFGKPSLHYLCNVTGTALYFTQYIYIETSLNIYRIQTGTSYTKETVLYFFDIPPYMAQEEGQGRNHHTNM